MRVVSILPLDPFPVTSESRIRTTDNGCLPCTGIQCLPCTMWITSCPGYGPYWGRAKNTGGRILGQGELRNIVRSENAQKAFLGEKYENAQNTFFGGEIWECSTFQDLADHGKQGRPYKILTDEVVGRHMVAVRNIKAGEVGCQRLPHPSSCIIWKWSFDNPRQIILARWSSSDNPRQIFLVR